MAKATWNHRVVRRYRQGPGGVHYSWLEVTEVHYTGGKPRAFAVEMRAPSSGGDPDDNGSLDELHETLERMLKCLDRPILDEKADFPEGVDGN